MTEHKLSPLARNIRMIRNYRRLSQADLAEISRLSPKTIYLIEHGEHEPNMATVKAVAYALNLSPRFLMTDPDELSSTTRWLASLRMLFRGKSAPFRKAIADVVRRLSLSSETTSQAKR